MTIDGCSTSVRKTGRRRFRLARPPDYSIEVVAQDAEQGW